MIKKKNVIKIHFDPQLCISFLPTENQIEQFEGYKNWGEIVEGNGTFRSGAYVDTVCYIFR